METRGPSFTEHEAIKGTSTQDIPEPALEREVIEVAPGKAVAVITPKLVHETNENARVVYDMPAETTKAVNGFAVPKRCGREGPREASFVYSGNVRYSIAVVLSQAATQPQQYRHGVSLKILSCWMYIRSNILLISRLLAGPVVDSSCQSIAGGIR